MSNLLTLRKLHLFSPEKKILAEISFELLTGEVLLLRGDNGCGKSTFLRYLFHCLQHQKKSDEVSYKDLGSFAYLPQNLEQEFFIPATLSEVASMNPSSKPDELGLRINAEILPDSLANLKWNSASGGEKQRSVLAQTLLSPKALYLLDEPFNHLDSSSIDLFANLLLKRMDQGCSFIMATHFIPPALESSKVFQFQKKGVA